MAPSSAFERGEGWLLPHLPGYEWPLAQRPARTVGLDHMD